MAEKAKKASAAKQIRRDAPKTAADAQGHVAKQKPLKKAAARAADTEGHAAAPAAKQPHMKSHKR